MKIFKYDLFFNVMHACEHCFCFAQYYCLFWYNYYCLDCCLCKYVRQVDEESQEETDVENSEL